MQPYQVCERVELLAHHTALLSPARHLAVEEVKEEPEGNEGECRVDVGGLGCMAEAVSHRGKYRENTAEA